MAHQQIFDTLFRLEQEFWQSDLLSKAERDHMRDKHGITQPASQMLFAGELCFAFELKTKKCVIFSSMDMDSIVEKYRKHVVERSGIFCASEQQNGHQYCLRKIEQNVSTDNYDLQSLWVMYPPCSASDVERCFCIGDFAPRTAGTGVVVHRSEKELADILDYPVTLPEGAEMQQFVQPNGPASTRMCEVAYIVLLPQERTALLTTYGCRYKPDQLQLVKQHFERYRDMCRDSLGLRLKLDIVLL